MTPVMRLTEELLGSASVGISALGGEQPVRLRLPRRETGLSAYGWVGPESGQLVEWASAA